MPCVLTVLSFNVNFELAAPGASLEAIASSGADLILLQETSPAWEALLAPVLAVSHPHRGFRHGFRGAGLGVISRWPWAERALRAAHPRAWFPSWRIQVATPAGALQVLQLHLRPSMTDAGRVTPSGYLHSRSIRQEEARWHLAGLEPSLPTLLAGDLNESRGEPAVRALQSQGFRSAVPRWTPTWRWPLAGHPAVRLELDHVLLGPGLLPGAAQVLQAGSSDHLPVRASFRLEP